MPKAQLQFNEIVDYIKRDSPDVSLKVEAAFLNAFEQLARPPGLGRARDDLPRQSLKFWSVHSYLVAYDPATVPLEILLSSGVRVGPASGWGDLARLVDRASQVAQSRHPNPRHDARSAVEEVADRVELGPVRLTWDVLVATRGCTRFPQAVHTCSTEFGEKWRKTARKAQSAFREILGLP
jgi:plasmid stabilization system protein ParE